MFKSIVQKLYKSRMMRITCVLLCVVAVLYFLRAPILRAAGAWLDVSGGKIGRADIIYVYAGGEAERPAYAAQLFRQGLAPLIMTAGSMKTDKLLALGIRLSEGEVNRQVLIDNGMPRDRIICVNQGTSTWEETNMLHGYMRAHNMRTAILVTSNFHTRRVRMTVRKVFRGDDMKFYYTAPHNRPITRLDAWWTNEDGLITVNNEYVKLFYYLAHYILR